MMAEYPEHNNGDAQAYIYRFQRLEMDCNSDINRYARAVNDIDIN